MHVGGLNLFGLVDHSLCGLVLCVHNDGDEKHVVFVAAPPPPIYLLQDKYLLIARERLSFKSSGFRTAAWE